MLLCEVADVAKSTAFATDRFTVRMSFTNQLAQKFRDQITMSRIS